VNLKIFFSFLLVYIRTELETSQQFWSGRVGSRFSCLTRDKCNYVKVVVVVVVVYLLIKTPLKHAL